MAELKVDLSVLNNLNIPEIAFSAEQETNLTDEDTDNIKNEVVEEINSLEEFVGTTIGETTDEETETTETTQTTTNESTSETELSPVRALAEWAGEKGLFEFDPDKFEDTEEFLENKFKETIDNGVTSYKESLPEEIHRLIENYEEGVPLDELIYSKSREIEYNSVDEDKLSDNTALQKRLVADWIANTDPEATNEEITKKIQQYEDSLLLEDEAKTALKKLQKFEANYQKSLVENVKAQKAADKKRFEQELSNFEKQVLSTEEFLPGIKLTKDERQKLFDIYTKTDSKGQTALMKKIAADPLANLKIAQLFGLYDGKLDVISTKLKTKATEEIKKTVSTYSEKSPLSKINIDKLKQGMKIIKNQQ